MQVSRKRQILKYAQQSMLRLKNEQQPWGVFSVEKIWIT